MTIKKRLSKIRKLVNYIYRDCIGVGSLSKTKDAITEIMAILQALESEAQDKGRAEK